MKTENEKNADPEPPYKKVRWKYQAKHAQDMSPMTLERAKLKGGWVVTALGRMHRPLRMKPSRPLPPIPPTSSSNSKKESERKAPMKMRKRIKKPDVRARIQKIDMVKYGSEYLKGRFLEVDHPFSVDSRAGRDVQIGKESMGSDVGEISLKQAHTRPQTSQNNSDHSEVVPQGDHEAAGEDVDVEMEDISSEPNEKTPKDFSVDQRVPKVPETSNKLRDLFAPAENEGMWSHISMIHNSLLVLHRRHIFTTWPFEPR